MKTEVWTKVYAPFILGGSPHKIVKCVMDLEKPQHLGRGYTGYVIKSPKGRIFIAESSSGAFVGGDIEEVRKEILNGDEMTMREQIRDSHITRRDNAEIMSEERFWELVDWRKSVDG